MGHKKKEPARCDKKGCDALITFIPLKNGSWLPVNLKPVEYMPDPNGSGRIFYKGRTIRALVGEEFELTHRPGDQYRIGYVPHWATCTGEKRETETERRSREKAEEKRRKQALADARVAKKAEKKRREEEARRQQLSFFR